MRGVQGCAGVCGSVRECALLVFFGPGYVGRMAKDGVDDGRMSEGGESIEMISNVFLTTP